MIRSIRRAAVLAVVVAGAGSAPVAGQSILLDKPVRAGELTLFPDLNDSLAYYYVADKAKLATRPDGMPAFSFLRYVDNVRTASDQPEAREGDGGGIVHALVSLAVSEEQLRDALRELRRGRPGARIAGPVMYQSGRFTLVSSFRDPQSGFTRQVVGIGNAPLLDGHAAAVSIQLTKLGAKVLWQSFQTPTPDISFSFEMEMKGYQAPMRATIEANLDQLYEHQAFAAAAATTYFGAEIKGAFDDLRREGAIRLVDVGADADLERLISTAYNKLVDVVFQPAQGTSAPDLGSVAGAGSSQQGLLDRATTLLNTRRAETRADNEGVRERNDARRRAAGEAAAARATVTQLEGRAAEAERRARSLQSRAQAARQRVTVLQQQLSALGTGASGERADGLRALIAGAESAAAGAERLAEEATAEAQRAGEQLGPARAEAARTSTAEETLEETNELPGFAAMAVFEMKRVRQRGFYRVDLNKYTTGTRTLRFDQNIGDLRQYLGRDEIFRQANLDDPLFRQREIVAFLDGFNATDFGQYINFVTVQLRKRHADGQETVDETRVDRANFSREGNQFKLLYGWRGDNDRRRWMDFEIRTQWSFFGGSAVDEPWRPANSGAIALIPPYQLRHLTLEGDPEQLRSAEVRSVTAKVFYSVAGRERLKQVTLTAGREPMSTTVDFMAAPDAYAYEYELQWRLTGNRTLSSGRKQSTDAIIYLDELPGR